MDTIFINSENSKNSESHVLIDKLTNKLDLRIGEKTIALSNLSINYTLRNIKISHNNNNGMILFNYQMNRILYQIFKIILSIF